MSRPCGPTPIFARSRLASSNATTGSIYQAVLAAERRGDYLGKTVQVMGQGVHTVALQVAAQELAIDPNRIDVVVDTTHDLGFGQTTGSRGTHVRPPPELDADGGEVGAGLRPHILDAGGTQ